MFGVENCQILSNLRKYIEIYCITVIQILVSDTSHYENVPFEVPAGWVWVKLSDICIVARGGSPRPIKEYLTDNPDGVNWIKIGDTDKDGKYINSTKEKIRPEGVSKSRMVHKGDFLLTNSMSFGRPYILNVDGCIHDGWLAISPLSGAYDTEFLYYLLSSNFAFEQFTQTASGGVVSNLNSDKVSTCIFPLPPLAEQRRIVVKINVWLKVIEEIANDSIEIQSQIQQLKTLILDSAITGKLVRQNLDDEPAIELLKKVNPEYKPCDNRHYENLPSGWQEVAFDHIFKSIPTKRFQVQQKEIQPKGTIPVISQSANYIEGYTDDIDKIFTATPVIVFGDHTRVVKFVDFPFVVGADGVKIYSTKIFPPYGYYLIEHAAHNIENKGYGRHSQYIAKQRYPLPPFDEQKRIVESVRKMFMIIDSIVADL